MKKNRASKHDTLFFYLSLSRVPASHLHGQSFCLCFIRCLKSMVSSLYSFEQMKPYVDYLYDEITHE